MPRAVQVRRMTKTLTCGIAILSLAFLLVVSVDAAPEYLTLTGTGNDMAPAICDGDSVTVKLCNDGSLIKAGPQNGTNPGDIIVYCTIATPYRPSAMWTCGRAVYKYFNDGNWYFKTKLDNAQEPDPWEVPEYFILGVVVQVTHDSGYSSASSETQTPQANPLTDTGSLLLEFVAGSALGLVLGALTVQARNRHKRAP
jgi:hypothetical protein